MRVQVRITCATVAVRERGSDQPHRLDLVGAALPHPAEQGMVLDHVQRVPDGRLVGTLHDRGRGRVSERPQGRD